MKDETLYTLFRDFVFDIYPLLDPALEKKWIKNRYDKYPSLKYRDNGMPYLSNYSHNAPYNITDLFRGWGGKADIEIKEFQSYKELEAYLLNHKEYRETIYPTNKEGLDRKRFDWMAIQVIEDILERYYLLNKSKQQDETLFQSIYMEFEHYTYTENLEFDIAIPILFLQFEESEHVINDGMLIRRIGDDYQRARFNVRSTSSLMRDSVIAGATHELVFKNWHIKKEKKYADTSLSNEKAFPIAQFELFFNAIKIATNYNSGFAQILIYPKGWADFYSMDLPPLSGLTVRKYPNVFDDHSWNDSSVPVITSAETQRIASIYENLLTSDKNKIQFANKRLRSSYLRDNEEDTILDIIIALETLLSDNDKGELTHKLAMRTAKLLSVYNKKHNVMHVFQAIKKIYSYRSAVVHGTGKADSKREIKLHNEADPIPAISLANDYLREVLGIMIEHPEYLNAEEVDRLLLEG
ncbi:HEPN domain-containing protein [Chitinophaga pinensis]|uniref:Apea-like HEPN domain-containing protein n=1 Tax=Chitinophaga pinensis (strain ATCC 43595 / DSM 2588 / LMG 13176 / NBRC 15968 / NCIMB 11800 / UQM 2034) TaxID=485918 RepID=A0A979G4U9_CHIPD|nr:HEPN domain-containing protein [Chitinophaga pinensis]ACU60658.1 hypothetical protein Cpin_3191 [Chitinophaga pinensis DSM 2588]